MAHPHKYDEGDPALKRLRRLCLSFGEVVEKEAWGECTFCANGGAMFAVTASNHHHRGHLAVWIKASATVQKIMIKSTPGTFFKPPLGSEQWLGVRLDRTTNWSEVTALLAAGYLNSAWHRPWRATPTATAAKANE